MLERLAATERCEECEAIIFADVDDPLMGGGAGCPLEAYESYFEDGYHVAECSHRRRRPSHDR